MRKLILEFVETQSSKHTRSAYKNDLSDYIDFIGNDKKVNDITVRDIESFKNHLSKTGLSRNTQSRKMATIRAFHRFLYRIEVVDSNKAENVSLPKVDKGKTPMVLNMDEVQRLVIAVTGSRFELRDKLIIMLFVTTGMRVSELVGLNKSDIDGNSITIREGKGGKTRVVRVNNEILTMINEYLETRIHTDGDALFTSQLNNRLSVRTIQSMVKRYVRKARLNPDVSVHTLRHTSGTQMLRNGVDIVTIQEILGHSSIETTRGYLHITEKERQEAVNTFEGIISI